MAAANPAVNVPFHSIRCRVPDEWIDVNGHMNAMHFMRVIYDAHVAFTESIGLGGQYVASTRHGKAVLESRMVYESEVLRGQEIETISWLLAVDRKRMHFCHELLNVSTNRRAALSEQVDIHVDLALRQSAELPSDRIELLRCLVRAARRQALPHGLGRSLRVPQNAWLEDVASTVAQ